MKYKYTLGIYPNPKKMKDSSLRIYQYIGLTLFIIGLILSIIYIPKDNLAMEMLAGFCLGTGVPISWRVRQEIKNRK